MKKILTFVTISIIVLIVSALIFLMHYHITIYEYNKNDNKQMDEEDVLWTEDFGTREYQYNTVAEKFEENAQYFVDLQQYYDSINYSEILTRTVLQGSTAEINGITYSVFVFDESVELEKQPCTSDVLYGDAETEIAKRLNYCQTICVYINKTTGELERIHIDVTNEKEEERVWLVWSAGETAVGHKLSKEGWYWNFKGGTDVIYVP